MQNQEKGIFVHLFEVFHEYLLLGDLNRETSKSDLSRTKVCWELNDGDME